MYAILGMAILSGALYAVYYIGKEAGRHEAQEENRMLDDDYDFGGED